MFVLRKMVRAVARVDDWWFECRWRMVADYPGSDRS